MTQSPEYPDLAWMPPRSWTNANRTSVQLIVVHTTEGAARGSSAEGGAAYDQRRTDGTSTHYFHDSDSTVQCVATADQAHAARAQGNKRGIQHELCTRAGTANWTDPYHQAMLRKAARQAARDATKWDIPIRHLTVKQIQAGEKGFCGHYDITMAFPQDNGTHTDPGQNFPWSPFLDMVRAEMIVEDFMGSMTQAQADDMRQQVWHTWLMTRNIESLTEAMCKGLEVRPKWEDPTTGYTFPAIPITGNIALKKLLGADGVSEAELSAALAANAQTIVDALGTELPDQP